MAQVSVKDVSEIRAFAVGIQDFEDRYINQLHTVEGAIQNDADTARRLLEALESKMEAAENHLRSCEQALNSYLSSQSGRKDSNGNPIPPDPDVVSRLTGAIRDAEERLARARRRYEKGKEAKHKACVLLEMTESAVSSARGIIRDCVCTACSAIEHAATHIESYKS